MKKQVSQPTPLEEGVWQFNEANDMGPYVDAYLIVGREKALLVDALETATGLYEAVRAVTDKPLEVFLTHGHPDHAGAAVPEFLDAGVPVRLSERDWDMLPPGLSSRMTDVEAGEVFDLGGFTLNVLSLAGHTPGSLALLDFERQLLFSGDGVGSGNFWMQLPSSLPLRVFLRELESLAAACEALPELHLYPGHRNQSPVQLGRQYLRDTLGLTRDLVSGTVQGEESSLRWPGGEMRFYQIARGQMLGYCYDPAKL